jgi:hypothetical protein
MTLDYQIDKEDFIVTLVADTTLTDAEAEACIRRLRADPDLAPCMPVLVDASGLLESSLSRTGVKAIMDILEATNSSPGEARTAFVVTKSGLAVMADYFGITAENRGLKHRMRTFFHLNEAYEWLRETP